MSEPVLFGRGRNSFRELSNFHVCPIVFDGREYATVEHYFQACKAQDDASHEAIRQAPTPKQARAMGRALTGIWPDWESRKIDVMRRALMAKFSQHPELRQVLTSTDDRPIHEDSAHDAEWGWMNGAGRDLLGRLLVEVREALRTAE